MFEMIEKRKVSVCSVPESFFWLFWEFSCFLALSLFFLGSLVFDSIKLTP